MDDLRVGRICRALRRRRTWRQRDLAERAGCHQTTISRIERGQGGQLPLRTIRAVFAAMEASFDGTVAWRAGDLDRLLDERHAAVVEAVARVLRDVGWTARLEVSYSEWGERGSIDVFAAHPGTHAVAVFEIKSDITRIEETLRRHGDKARLAHGLALKTFGWRAESVARILVVPEDRTIRRIVDRHEATFRTAYPLRSRELRRWLAAPVDAAAGIWFLTLRHGTLGSQRGGGPRRVRVGSARSAELGR